MTEPQMNLLGDHAQPTDLELGPVQRIVMRKLRQTGSLSKAEVGAIAHSGRGRHSIDDTCMFCGVDGEGICESLVQRDLAEWTPEGDIHVRAIVRAAEPLDDPDDTDPFPDGF